MASLRSRLRDWIPPALLRLWQRPSPDPVEDYLRGGRVPWSRGYIAYKHRFVASVLADPDRMASFRDRSPLPPGYGVGLDERCVEFPWALARLGEGPLLDAGSTLNHGFVLESPQLATRPVVLTTLAPEAECHWQAGHSYVFADLRDLPFRDGWFGTVACLSTLEHVGFDNAAFTGRTSQASDPTAYRAALQELRRVLRPGGRLLLTVPFGPYGDHGTFQLFDEALLESAVQAFGPCLSVERTWYRYRADGWQAATAAEAADAGYVGWIMDQRGPFPVQPDNAAAARAVACVKLVRG